MTPNQVKALRWAATYAKNWTEASRFNAWPLSADPRSVSAIMSRLIRDGLVEVVTQSESVHGADRSAGRISYKLYRITDAGRRASNRKGGEQ